MRLLEEMELVKRFNFGDGTARPELLGRDEGHLHPLICRECKTVVEISDCFPHRLSNELPSNTVFDR